MKLTIFFYFLIQVVNIYSVVWCSRHIDLELFLPYLQKKKIYLKNSVIFLNCNILLLLASEILLQETINVSKVYLSVWKCSIY